MRVKVVPAYIVLGGRVKWDECEVLSSVRGMWEALNTLLYIVILLLHLKSLAASGCVSLLNYEYFLERGSVADSVLHFQTSSLEPDDLQRVFITWRQYWKCVYKTFPWEQFSIGEREYSRILAHENEGDTIGGNTQMLSTFFAWIL